MNRSRSLPRPTGVGPAETRSQDRHRRGGFVLPSFRRVEPREPLLEALVLAPPQHHHGLEGAGGQSRIGFEPSASRQPTLARLEEKLATPDGQVTRTILAKAGTGPGICVVFGSDDLRLVHDLLRTSRLRVAVIETDAE